MAGLAKRLFGLGLNWLLVFLPMAVVLELAHKQGASWAPASAVFVVSALAIIPLAGWMGRATEHLAVRLGEGIGGLLNATLGNAAELIIAAVALWEATDPAKTDLMHGVVKASITGSIIGNVLLVLGLALLVGGLRYRTQSFNATAARAGATLMTIAAGALVLPALFSALVPGAAETVDQLSVEIAVVLLFCYGLSLVFSLKTHRHLYAAEESSPQEHHEPAWPVWQALGVLAAVTLGIALLAEFMIGSVEEAAHQFGLSDVFVGVVIVAVVGNAAEHSTAVLVAAKNRMDLALGIAVGSSIQVAILIAPFLVLLSHALGAPMNFVFTIPEIVAVLLCVWTVDQIAGDGQSNWLEGAMLLVVYGLIALLFYHLPAETAAGIAS